MADLPKVPIILIGASMLGAAWMQRKSAKAQAAADSKAVSAPATAQEPESLTHLLGVDPISIEIGYGLISLADATTVASSSAA